MNRTLADRFLSPIPEKYKHSFIAQQLTSNPKMTFLKVFECFHDQYVLATEETFIENTAKLLDS